MRTHLVNIGIGVVMIVVGILMRLNLADVHTPIVTLTKVGTVLAVVGAIEVVVSAFTLISPAARRKSSAGG